MDEYALPTGPEVPAADAVRSNWAATVAALPVGTGITGEVIGRQRFGVFIRIDGMPNAIALAEITAMPHGMDLPAALGVSVSGEVLWHAAHNHQVKVRLDEWRTADE
ncbi:RNA-binding protein [Streptomyces sp. Ru62]|uniref:RNA-binding protein n=1 Tax=Streptomyces sp. Ru62 TaxID=2080745 RepID=UPI000CDD4FDC|nr:RNA-binding protein [Streptomyces sp. Ru62]POX60581.1 RNA-binding protein [Streptomyces sp. Ru62]